MPREYIRKWNIGVAPLFVQLGKDSFQDGVNLSTEEFYRWCRTHTEIPQTAQPSVGVCEKLIRESLEEHDHVICFTVSSSLSSTLQAFRIASEEYKKSVTVFDTLSVSLGITLLVLHAVELIEKGSDIDEILLRLQEARKHQKVIMSLQTLEYAIKGGRVTRWSPVDSDILSIKPILHIDCNGYAKVLEKVRSERLAFRFLINTMKDTFGDTQPLRIGIAHGDSEDQARKFMQIVREELNPKEIIFSQIGSVIGSHIGPGALLVSF